MPHMGAWPRLLMGIHHVPVAIPRTPCFKFTVMIHCPKRWAPVLVVALMMGLSR